MGTFETIYDRCRICVLNLSYLTCAIAIFGEQSANFNLQRKIEKYLQITVSSKKNKYYNSIMTQLVIRTKSYKKTLQG